MISYRPTVGQFKRLTGALSLAMMDRMARVVKKADERRSDIVNVARGLFETKGFEKTTMQNVMEHLGIAKGTIYHYFKSKEELFEAVIEKIVEANIEETKKALKKSRGGALEKIRYLTEKGSIAKEHSMLVDHLHQPANQAMHVRLLAAILVKQAAFYTEVVLQGCKEGIFKTDHPLEAVEFILAGIQFLTDVGIYPWTPDDLKRRIEAFPRIIERQLQAPKGSFDFLIKQMVTD